MIQKRNEVMKKTYIIPAQQCIDLCVGQMLAGSTESITIDSSKNVDTQFSDKKGWSSESWTSADED